MRWPRSLLVRLLAPYLIALVAVAASLYAYTDAVVERLYLDTLADGVLREARLAGNQLPWDLRGPALDQRCAALAADTRTRVTVIAADGTVIGDSDAPSATLENHRNRPEVRAALRDGDGRGVRFSASVHRPLFYRAVRQTRGDEQRVIRLAVAMTIIDRARHRIRTAIWGGVLAAALAALWPAWVLAKRLSTRVQRLAEFSNAAAAGEAASPLTREGDDIISRLETNLVAMAASLSAQLRAAREEKGKLEGLLSGMVEGVLVIDRDGVIRLSNQRAERLFGRTPPDTLVGEPLIHVTRDPDLHELVRAVTRGTAAQPLACEITPEGHRRETLQVTAAPIAEAGGPPELFILVFHDISELKKLEATRRDFVANVSHELRTPLTAIRGYAETLQAGALTDPELARKFVGVIERHSERLSRLTDDLLTLSDLELGRAGLHRAPMQLAPAVDAAIDVLRDRAAHGRVEIHRDLPPDVPPIYADTDRLEQVLVNLIDNAVKYTPAGGRVTVSARVVPRPHGDTTAPRRTPTDSAPWVEIIVSDTGIGIPSHELPRLTERFYRVDKARSRELGGTGLGLAIVKHILQAHGGVLHIESETGRGTRVYVFLPTSEGREGATSDV